jgi:hypothetical protein
MILKFHDQSLTLTQADVEHFNILADLDQLEGSAEHGGDTEIAIDNADSGLFLDLLNLCKRPHACDNVQNDDYWQWIYTKMLEHSSGYLRDLLALACFLGNTRAEAFGAVITRVLSESNDDTAMHILGLQRC